MNETSGVQRMLRSKQTGLWLDTAWEWTADLAQARCFNGIVEAMRAVESAGLRDIQFVIHFLHSTQSDFVINLPDSRAVRSAQYDPAGRF